MQHLECLKVESCRKQWITLLCPEIQYPRGPLYFATLSLRKINSTRAFVSEWTDLQSTAIWLGTLMGILGLVDCSQYLCKEANQLARSLGQARTKAGRQDRFPYTLRKKSWNEECFVHTLRFLCFVHRIEVGNVPQFNVAHFYLILG